MTVFKDDHVKSLFPDVTFSRFSDDAMTKRIAIIPARGGSKRIPKKYT